MKRIFLLISLFFLTTTTVFAGIFDLPSFLEPGHVSVGAEGEFAVNHGTGAAVNIKPRYGFTDFLNAEAIIGTGVGSRKFRIGAIADLEWFPDINNQPGIATPLTVLYTSTDANGITHFGPTPLVYKTFGGAEGLKYTPFLGFPLGWSVKDSKLEGSVQFTMGAMIKGESLSNWKFSIEAGFNLYQSYSYISGGAVYNFGYVAAIGGNKAAAPAAGAEGTNPEGTVTTSPALTGTGQKGGAKKQQ